MLDAKSLGKSKELMLSEDLNYYGFIRNKETDIVDITQLDDLYQNKDSGYYLFAAKIPTINEDIHHGVAIVFSFGEFNTVQVIIASGVFLYRFRQGSPSKWGDWHKVAEQN